MNKKKKEKRGKGEGHGRRNERGEERWKERDWSKAHVLRAGPSLAATSAIVLTQALLPGSLDWQQFSLYTEDVHLPPSSLQYFLKPIKELGIPSSGFQETQILVARER